MLTKHPYDSSLALKVVWIQLPDSSDLSDLSAILRINISALR